ncbi:MAG TPA: ATP-binding protein [Bradyrhizobium sp.]|nr:ATP-binding protein [Bradyrhizobium sp.]
MRHSRIDGRPRQYSYRRVGEYPLVVTVGLELDEVLATVRSHERTVLIIAGTASVIFLTLSILLTIEFRRRSRQEIALAEQHAKLEEDIELRRQMEQQLLHAGKMQAIGTLAGGVAHELNNALLPILILTRLLLDKLPENGTEHECARNIALAGERAQGLVKGILTFSRKHESVKGDVDLARLVGDLLPMLKATLPKSIKLVTELSPVPAINADAHALQGVIVNLVTNAMHAIGTAAGRITIALEPAEFASGSTAQAVTLQISDTGCGMDAKTLDRIFEPFFTTKDVGTGTGLGLSVAHGVVEDHDGHIEVHSEPGKGTVFSIRLPVVEHATVQLFDKAA